MTPDESMIRDYLSQATTTDFKLVESKTEELSGILSQEIKLRMNEEDVETSAFGIMYVISLLSFLQGLPAGMSEIDYREHDAWSTEDFLRHLSFVHGKLHFHADYVRGRLMKTTVEVFQDETVRVATVNRGDLATLWSEYLLGKGGILEFIDPNALGSVQ